MISRYVVVLVVCASLGLAPFFPEPHLVGKLRWVAGGAVGMQAQDWFDLLFHGAPWGVLLGMGAFDTISALTRRDASPEDPEVDET